MRDAFEPHREPEPTEQPEASTSKLPVEDEDEDEDEQPRTTSCKVLITTSPKCTRATYDFCDELVGVFPDSEFVRRRRKNNAFSIGNISVWAGRRGYTTLIVVNEDRKVPSASDISLRYCGTNTFLDAITMVQLPDGPTAYFKLTSIELTKEIFVRTTGLRSAALKQAVGSCSRIPTLSRTHSQRFRNNPWTYSRKDVSAAFPALARV